MEWVAKYWCEQPGTTQQGQPAASDPRQLSHLAVAAAQLAAAPSPAPAAEHPPSSSAALKRSRSASEPLSTAEDEDESEPDAKESTLSPPPQAAAAAPAATTRQQGYPAPQAVAAAERLASLQKRRPDTLTEAEKKEKTRLANREAARRVRQRRADAIERLQAENAALLARVRQLEELLLVRNAVAAGPRGEPPPQQAWGGLALVSPAVAGAEPGLGLVQQQQQPRLSAPSLAPLMPPAVLPSLLVQQQQQQQQQLSMALLQHPSIQQAVAAAAAASQQRRQGGVPAPGDPAYEALAPPLPAANVAHPPTVSAPTLVAAAGPASLETPGDQRVSKVPPPCAATFEELVRQQEQQVSGQGGPLATSDGPAANSSLRRPTPRAGRQPLHDASPGQSDGDHDGGLSAAEAVQALLALPTAGPALPAAATSAAQPRRAAANWINPPQGIRRG